jgi:uncharacterized protein YhjY with autotransporter beta-barrel domain
MLSGTPPATAGPVTVSFTATVRDTNNATGKADYSLSISPPIVITLTPAAGALPLAVVGTTYSQQLSASGGTGPYSYSAAPGALPSWLTLSASGLLSGTPPAAGNLSFAVTVRDSTNATGGATYSLAVSAPNVQRAKDITTPQAVIAVSAPTVQLNNVRQRLDQLRLERSPTIADALRVTFGGQSLPSTSTFGLAPLDKNGKPQSGGDVSALALLDKDGKPQSGGGASADSADSFDRWGFFINGDINIGRQSAVDTQTGFKLTSKGVTIGTDYRFTGNNVLGVSLGYLRADTDLNGGAGSADADGYSVSLYGSYVPVENAYIYGIVNFGHNNYDSQRIDSNIQFDSSTSGDQWGLAVSGGYEFNRGPLAMSPYVRAEYVDAKVDGFTESGGRDALVVGEQRIKATTLTVGGQVSYAISTSWGVLIPNGRVEFQHIANRNVNNIQVGYVTGPPSTPLVVLGDDRNFGTFAAGVSGVFPNGVGAFFNYEQLFGKDNFSNRHYTLGLRVEF